MQFAVNLVFSRDLISALWLLSSFEAANTRSLLHGCGRDSDVRADYVQVTPLSINLEPHPDRHSVFMLSAASTGLLSQHATITFSLRC